MNTSLGKGPAAILRPKHRVLSFPRRHPHSIRRPRSVTLLTATQTQKISNYLTS